MHGSDFDQKIFFVKTFLLRYMVTIGILPVSLSCKWGFANNDGGCEQDRQKEMACLVKMGSGVYKIGTLLRVNFQNFGK